MRKILGLAILPSLIIATIVAAQTSKPAFTLTISTPQTTVKSGADVPLNIEMKNTSGQGIFYGMPLGQKQSMYKLTVVDAAGTAVAMNPDATVRDGPRAGSIFSAALRPGESLKTQQTLSKEFDLGRPGTYTVQAQRYDGTSGITVKSNTITVTVAR